MALKALIIIAGGYATLFSLTHNFSSEKKLCFLKKKNIHFVFAYRWVPYKTPANSQCISFPGKKLDSVEHLSNITHNYQLPFTTFLIK